MSEKRWYVTISVLSVCGMYWVWPPLAVLAAALFSDEAGIRGYTR